MTATFAGKLAAGEHRSMRLLVLVQGIPYAFTEDPLTVNTGITTRTNVACVEKIEQGETSLDWLRRREVGGSLTVSMLDTSSHTLRGIFRPRSRRSTWVTSTISDVDATINVNSTSGLPASGTVYIDGESITYSALAAGPPRLTGCTRGAYTSEARSHIGGTETGAGVFQYAPSWTGRRVTLIGYFCKEDGTSSSGLGDVIGTFRLEEAPVYLGHDRWELRCGSVAEEIAKLKVGSGIAPAQFFAPTRNANGDYVFNIAQGSMAYAFPNNAANAFYVRVESPNGNRFVAPVGSVAGGAVTVGKDTISPVLRHRFEREPDDLWTLTPICIMANAAPAALLLQVLESRLGTTANGAYDNLPGTQRTNYGDPELRMGAGLAVANIDTSSISSVASYQQQWTFTIDTEMPLENVLADFCLVTNSMWGTAADGLLTFRSLAETSNSAGTTINSGVLVDEPRVEWDEGGVFPRISIKCNYDVVAGDFATELNVIDSELQERYRGREDALAMESRSIYVTDGGTPKNIYHGLALPGIDRDSARDLLRRIQTGGGRGRVTVSMTCTGQVWGLGIGDAVTVVATDLPDYDGGAMSAYSGRVTARQPDYDKGTVNLQIESRERLYVIAPVGIVSSVSAGPPYVVTLDAAAYENDGNPEDGFAAWSSVIVWDVSGATSETKTITAIGVGTITLDSAPAFALAAGDVIFTPAQASAVSSPTSAAGYAPIDFTYQIPDNENDASVAFVTRWR